MLQDYTKDEKFVKIVDSRRNGYVERLKKLEIIVSYLESAIKDISVSNDAVDIQLRIA